MNLNKCTNCGRQFCEIRPYKKITDDKGITVEVRENVTLCRTCQGITNENSYRVQRAIFPIAKDEPRYEDWTLNQMRSNVRKYPHYKLTI